MISVNAHLHKKDRVLCHQGTPRSLGPTWCCCSKKEIRVPHEKDQVGEAAWKKTGSSWFSTGKMGLLLNEGCACT